MFQVGDEVEKFANSGPKHPLDSTGDAPIGHRGKVIAVGTGEGEVWIDVDTWPVDPICGHAAREWRKVQKRKDSLTLESFLTPAQIRFILSKLGHGDFSSIRPDPSFTGQDALALAERLKERLSEAEK